MTFCNLISKIRKSKFIKFAIVGAIGTVIDFGVMNLLVIVFKIPKLFAQAVSFTLAVINNYLLNRIWTYPESRSKSALHQFSLFLLISLVGLGIRTPLFAGLSWGITLLVEKANSPTLFFKPDIIGNNVALAICIVVVLMWNYFANRKWTFNEPSIKKVNTIEPSTKN